jgi:hypothetical protein
MSWILADRTMSGETRYIADGPTNSGLEAFVEWAATPVLAAFLEDGETDELTELIEELETTKATGGVEESRLVLLVAARKAEGTLVLSDGL